MHQQNVSVVAFVALMLGCGTKDDEMPAGIPNFNFDSGINADDSGDPETDVDTDTDIDTDTDSDSDTDADTDSDSDTDTDDTGGPVGTDADGDGVTVEAGDCDDSDADRFPGNSEACNGIDNDCDGEIDAPDPIDGSLWYPDFDGDSWGSSRSEWIACGTPTGASLFPGDCNDLDPEISPSAIEICDLEDNNCNGIVDADAVEGVTYYRDLDGDGYGNPDHSEVSCTIPSGYVENNLDCNDSSSLVSPDRVETCNGVDDDCDGAVDDGYELSIWYEDADGDGHGDPLVVAMACSPPSYFVAVGGDCDDSDPAIHGDMAELCDEKDNDCDGVTDEDLSELVFYRDLDGDGYGTPDDEIIDCAPVPGYVVENTDCDDSDDSIWPGRSEECNGIDDNCNGEIDETHPLDPYFLDADADGFGAGEPVYACAAPEAHVLDGTDCDDADYMVNPSIYADCEDGRDEDCDGEIDEGPDSTFYRDYDGDGYGDPAVTLVDCAPPDGWVWDASDCNDADDDVHPDHREVCSDVIDNDCDGLDDESDPDCDCPDHGYVEDQDLGTTTGDSVATGDTTSEDDTYTYGECGSSGGRDRFFLFEAPESGCYDFNTEGSTYDTLIRVLDACEGTSIACNDDYGGTLRSRVAVSMEMGDTVFVVVDGYSSYSYGPYVLNISYDTSAGSCS